MTIIPTIADVDHIAALENAVLRNLHITQCYFELSTAVAARLGQQANWCTFATWASKQAGQSIRKEDLAHALEHAVHRSSEVVLAARDVSLAAQRESGIRAIELSERGVLDAIDPFASVSRVSTAVARGNQKVFAEIGREFARFVAGCFADETYDGERIYGFCAALRDGEPPHGQRYLRQAFARYYRALFEHGQDKRAELILHANLEIGFHEQTRLQPEIKAAMEASTPDPDPIARQILLKVYPARGDEALVEMRTRSLLGAHSPLDAAIERLLEAVRQQMRMIVTKCLLSLWIPPDVRLSLGDDLSATFPANLQRIASRELRAFLAEVDPTPNSLRNSGADDWGDLPDRLHFIADLFRCYQQSPDLWSSPFTDEQLAALQLGTLPTGRL